MGEKEKKYYWLRLKRDFFKRHDIQIIEAMPNGKDYILFYLKLLCESVDHEGCLRFSDAIPYSEQMLSTITNTNIDVVRSAIKVFLELKMMEVMDDGTYYMCEVNKMLGYASQDDHTRETTRLRVQAYRDRKKQELIDDKRYCNVTSNDVTDGDRYSNVTCNDVTVENRYGNVTCNGEIEIEKEIDIELEKELEIEKDKEKKIKQKREAVTGKSDSKPKKPEKVDGEPVNVYFDDIELNQAFEDFIAMRKKVRKPLTDRATSLAKKKLETMATDASGFNVRTAIEILNNSTMNSWTGLYPLKHESHGKNQKIDWQSL